MLTWDVFGYYLYLPATFLYHDIGLQNIDWINHILATYDNTQTFYQASRLESGYWVNKYSAGMALFYLPFFLLGHVAAWLTGFPTDGFSVPYQLAIIASSLFYILLGLVFLRRVLLRYVSDRTTALTLILLAWGTNFYHQQIYSLAMSHNYLFAGYAVLIWQLHKDKQRQQLSALTGLICAVMILARPSEIISLVLVGAWMYPGRLSKAGFRQLGKVFQAPRFWLPLVLIGSLQVIYWWITTGYPVYYTYDNPGEGFDLLRPHTWSFLFSFRKGWLIYTPLMVFALIGFYAFRKKQPREAWAILLVTFVNVYLLSSWTTWWYAESFSQRSMVQSYALLAIPLACWVEGILANPKWSWLLVLPVLFLGLNQFQSWQYNNSILNGSRMTAAAYFRHFTRTEPLDEEARGFLLIERSATAVETMPDDPNLEQTDRLMLDFETGIPEDRTGAWKRRIRDLLNLKPNSLDKAEGLQSDTARSGQFAYRTTAELPYSPALSIPFETLVEEEYAWVRISAWVYTDHPVTGSPFELVYTFNHWGGNYKYRALAATAETVVPGTWNRLTVQYMTPEPRSTSDELRIYVWNRGGKPVYVDDVEVSVYNPVWLPYIAYWD